MPMATQFSTSLILTTTTAGSENHFSQMSRIKDPDTGKPLFTTIRLGKPCDACLKAKGEFWTCDHKKSETPDWISGDKKKRFIIYYEGMNRVGDMQRELYSVETTNGERMYGDDEIAALKAATLYSSVLRPKLMFVGIDPNGGGESGYGVVSGFFDKGTLVVCITFPFTSSHFFLSFFISSISISITSNRISSKLQQFIYTPIHPLLSLKKLSLYAISHRHNNY